MDTLGCIHLWCISWNNAIYISMDMRVGSCMDMGILIGGYNIGESKGRVKRMGVALLTHLADDIDGSL